MLKTVSIYRRIPWETYSTNPLREWKIKLGIYAPSIVASNELLDFLISNFDYRMYRYRDPITDQYKMGYGYTDPSYEYGATENEAYSDWIKEVKRKERLLTQQLPVTMITESQFDALLSLYVMTGNWKKLRGEEGTYDIFSAVKSLNWQLVADMIANGQDKSQRLAEARILMLGDYSHTGDRNRLAGLGIQYARTQYVRGIPDAFSRKQAEYAFYRQTNGVFLPNMPELRKRQIVSIFG